MVDRPPGSRQGGGHIDGDDLAVLALDGARGDTVHRAHVARCADCAAEFARYAAVVDRVRGAAEDLPVDVPLGDADPGEDLWRRIVAEIGEQERSRSPGSSAASGSHEGLTDERAATWWRPHRWLAVAAGVVVIAVAAAGVVAIRTGAPSTALAEALLEPLADDVGAAARAELRPADGDLELLVDLPSAAPGAASGYLELWLLDEDVDGMVSLGPVYAGTSRVVLPAGLDVARYPVVDVSREPLDGDPTHSGDSIWRGTLDPT